MGCDIHIEVEVFEDGRWRNVTNDAVPAPRRGRRGPFSDEELMKLNILDPEPDERWYAVFAYLTGVRSHRDDKGIVGGRGLPADWDEKGAAEASDIWWNEKLPPDVYTPGDHSFTWALVSELQGVDWTYRYTTPDGGEALVDLRPSAFARWLLADRMKRTIERAGGSDKVRLILGFDS